MTNGSPCLLLDYQWRRGGDWRRTVLICGQDGETTWSSPPRPHLVDVLPPYAGYREKTDRDIPVIRPRRIRPADSYACERP
ncbi:hypothetical protein [Actinacidiphila oryziradicis]|uniref:Uncharacterized protein n=1 Tax=Actinacidiphila oryziradicis TaxID=2571141 RepID=A0A4U0SA63_9ACTN|nr:hypothetical protein [Actinacidiphila oryziradicis]TKA06190.1 hypothetical protein FCI23_32840 [Actinacidiphila oryziradicis]